MEFNKSDYLTDTFENMCIEENSQIGKGMQDALEILQYVNDICEKNQIKYTLIFESLLAVCESEKIPDWLNIIQIGMLYDDYKILLSELSANTETFYPITNNLDESFQDFFCRLYKRSRIVLPENRKKDERFYDNFIDIYPIYEVADTEAEYRRVKKKFVFYQKCIQARALVPDVRYFNKNFFKILKSKYYYAHRKNNMLREVEDYLKSKHKKGAKYVFIPVENTLKRKEKCANLYCEMDFKILAGKKVLCIKNAEYWNEQYWSKKRIKEIKQSPKNVVLQQGAETLRRVQLTALDILVEFDRICRKYNIKYMLAAGTLLGAARHKGFIPWDDDIDVFMLYEEWEKFESVYEKEIDVDKYFVRTQKTDVDNNLCFFQIKRNNTIYCKQGRVAFNTHPGVFIDILPYFYGANSFILHRLQEKVCKIIKTVTWTHMGAQSEPVFIKRKYYEFLQKHISNKKSSDMFFKIAKLFKESKYLCYLYVQRNPYKRGINQRRFFTQLTELEFEGHKFLVPKDYEEFLEYSYSTDYMMYPVVNRQFAHHFPAHIDLGKLHEKL